MFTPYFYIYLILSAPYTDALLHDAAVLIDVDSPAPVDLPLPGNPGTPGCIWTCTEPNWHGNCTYTCFGPQNEKAPTCIKNFAFQTSFGPDVGTQCNLYKGDACQSDGLLQIADPGAGMMWPGNPCMRDFGSFICWRGDGMNGTGGWDEWDGGRGCGCYSDGAVSRC